MNNHEKRGINPKLSIKLGDYFNIEKEYFMQLQASFEVENTLQESNVNPLIGKVRSSLFWDVDFDKLSFREYSAPHSTKKAERIASLGFLL